MKPATKFLLIVYLVVVCADLVFIVLHKDELRWFSKPLLMPVLILYFFSGALYKRGEVFWLIVLALCLSWCGDVLLQAEDLFIPGLISFLLAHVAYIGYFRTISRGQKGFLREKPILFLPVAVYIGLLLYLLFPNLGPLKIPVIIYSLTIGTMLLMALNNWLIQHWHTATIFIAGAVIFVVSDSLLAISLFAIKDLVFGPFIMAIYAAAQFLLVYGAIKRDEGMTPLPAMTA